MKEISKVSPGVIAWSRSTLGVLEYAYGILLSPNVGLGCNNLHAKIKPFFVQKIIFAQGNLS